MRQTVFGMSIADRALAANPAFVRSYQPSDGVRRPPKLVVLTCMDARLSRLDEILDIPRDVVQVMRNAGAIVTEDALRSIVLSVMVLGTPEVLIMGHTECAVQGLDGAALKAKLAAESGVADGLPLGFYGFDDVASNVAAQVVALREHPWLKRGILVRGMVYDVRTGALEEVSV